MKHIKRLLESDEKSKLRDIVDGIKAILIDFEDNNINNDNQLYIYKGCDKNHNTCSQRFNNINNFNGFPSVPNQNYFYKF